MNILNFLLKKIILLYTKAKCNSIIFSNIIEDEAEGNNNSWEYKFPRIITIHS